MKLNEKYRVKAFIKQHYKYLALVFIVLFFQFATLSKNMDRIHRRSLFGDYDGYWHLLRVREIHNSGSWDNEINFRGNAPFGERIHWTHAMDIVLFGGAYIGSFFVDFDSSLYWFGVLVGPLFYVLSLAAIIFFGRVILGAKHGAYLPLLFAVNYLQIIVYSVARPDHHCLVGFLFILYYFSFILLLRNPGSTVLAVLTGLLGALGLWSGVELLIIIGLSVLYLGILWIIDEDRYLKANFILTLVLSICTFITVLMDGKPGNYWIAAYDKRSIVHVMLFALIMLYWLTVIVLARYRVGKGVVSRIMIAFGGSVLLLIVYLGLFPGIIKGPMSQVDPKLYALYLDRTGEFSTNLDVIAFSVLLVSPGLIYLVWLVYKKAQRQRIVFSWLIVITFLYLAMAIMMNRWIYTLGVTSILPNALILSAMTNWQNNVKNIVLSFVITVSLILVPLLVPCVLDPEPKTGYNASEEYKYKTIDVLSFMESRDHTMARETVLANIWVGPAIMYHSSFNAIGTPNHNNDKGIIDTHSIFTAEDDTTAYAFIEARGIDYILVDEELKKFARIRTDGSGRSENTPENEMFIDRLTNGNIPDWLVKVPLPEGLSDTFWLYRVVERNVKGG